MTASRGSGAGLASGHECPICRETFADFLPKRERRQVECPGCRSRERHRHLWLYLQRETDFFDRPRRFLHIAPERCFKRRFERMVHFDYISGDLDPSRRGDVQIDVTNIQFPDEDFDAILCYHVLEHVPDDQTAMRELHRVLRPGGFAIIQVPVRYRQTDEDLSITSPDERLRRFGQSDHVRIYGRDFYERLRTAGFQVRPHLFRDQIAPQERERFGLDYHLPPGQAPNEADWVIPWCTKGSY